MFRTAVLAALIAFPATAYAQEAQVDTPPQRIRSVTLTGDQACPKSTAGEVVVCSTLDQPYRIPKSLREDKPIAAQNQSWVNRTAVADDAGRRAGGLPDTCSPVGSGGQTGCGKLRAEQFAAERAEARRQADIIP
jgi:hypothetical protein